MSTSTVTPTIHSGSYLTAIKTVTAPLIHPTTQVASVTPITVQTAGRRKNTRRKHPNSKKNKSNKKT